MTFTVCGRVEGLRCKTPVALIVSLGALAGLMAVSPSANAQLICSGSDVISGVLATCPPPPADDALPPIPPRAEFDEPKTFDEQLAAIADRVPAFGGMFVDEERDRLLIYMRGRNGSARSDSNVRIVVRALRRLSRAIDERNVKVLDARYGFGQLKRWKDRMGVLFKIRGVVSLDIEDSKNRLDVGLQDPGIRELVERALARLGVPREAVRFERRQPIVPDSSVNDAHRPLTGGLQISRPVGNNLISRCTLGFVAYSHRHQRWGFVTNSHCTANQGGVESTRFYQPFQGRPLLDRSGGNTNDAGTEVDDPGYYTCYVFYDCRYSDSAFIAFPDWFAWRYGTHYDLSIARAPGDACCTLAYDNLRGPIVHEAVPAEGHLLAKRGATTGFTIGKVTDACNDSFMDGGYVYRCQFLASYSRAGGDSGGPVFGGADGRALLMGIHHGAQGAEGSFSPITNIQRGGELGGLTNCRDWNC